MKYRTWLYIDYANIQLEPNYYVQNYYWLSNHWLSKYYCLYL